MQVEALSYYERNREKKLAAAKRRYQEKGPEIRAYAKQWYLDTKPKRLQQTQAYYNTHKAQIAERDKTIRKRINARRRALYATNTEYRIRAILRARFNSVVSLDCKKTSAVALLGCSVPFFKDYIAAKFTKGMSWRNHGLWHLDHIRPLASFDLTNSEEHAAAFHYTNIQPLWAIQNRRKHASVN
jgi:hypothetical protein